MHRNWFKRVFSSPRYWAFCFVVDVAGLLFEAWWQSVTGIVICLLCMGMTLYTVHSKESNRPGDDDEPETNPTMPTPDDVENYLRLVKKR